MEKKFTEEIEDQLKAISEIAQTHMDRGEKVSFLFSANDGGTNDGLVGLMGSGMELISCLVNMTSGDEMLKKVVVTAAFVIIKASETGVNKEKLLYALMGDAEA